MSTEKRDYYLIGWPQLPSKIHAIKAFRSATGATLVDSKEVMDRVEMNRYVRLSLSESEQEELRSSLLLLPVAPIVQQSSPDHREKVKVRIAAVVSASGKWNACGWSTTDDEGAMGIALEGLDEVGPEAQYWIEASLPVPQVETVQAESVEEVSA